MATYTKTDNQTLITLTDLANGAATSGELDVSTKISGVVLMRMGRTSSSAFTTNGVVFLVEVSGYAAESGEEYWYPYREFETALGSSIGSQAVSGTEAAGQTVVTLAAGTNFAARDYVFWHNTTLINSEWSRVLSVSGADLTLLEAITNAQTGATCRDQAEAFECEMDLSAVKKLRVWAINNTGQTAAVEVLISTGDSIG